MKDIDVAGEFETKMSTPTGQGAHFRRALAGGEKTRRETTVIKRDTYGTYIAGRAHIDIADAVAIEMEFKWGCGRLRLLVSAELCERFDRQRYLWNQAIWHGDLEMVRREASRMIAAWRKLDQAASQSGAAPLAPTVWEITLGDGTVAAIVPDNIQAHAVVAQGRKVAVYALDEIGRMLDDYRAVSEAKLTFPGATVEAIRRPANDSDPLNAIVDTKPHLDAPMDDPIPSFSGA